jgi:hypothetical protein
VAAIPTQRSQTSKGEEKRGDSESQPARSWRQPQPASDAFDELLERGSVIRINVFFVGDINERFHIQANSDRRGRGLGSRDDLDANDG